MNKLNQKRVIDPDPPKLIPYLLLVWQYRRLLLTLTRRNLKVKYAQTHLGLAWVILQPLTGMVVFTVFFSGIFDLSNFGITVPYYLFAYSGYATWIFFTYIVQSGGTALVQDEALIKKSFFPKLLLPLSRTLVGLVDYVIALLVLFLMAGFTGHLVYQTLIILPIIIIATTIVGWALAFWLSGLTIRYRDFIHLIPYLINFGIWLTPIFYPVTIIPSGYAFLSYFNPMTGIAEITRWAVLGTDFPDYNCVWSIIASVVILYGGLKYFLAVENEIADHI